MAIQFPSGGGVDAAGGRGGESHCGCHLDCFTPTVFAMTECVAFATMGKAVIAVTKQSGSLLPAVFRMVPASQIPDKRPLP
ncbi:hypothetical protein [uncultured Nitrosomonas sp.]|uniref:hypothetical protein n=1 Tax=uncultured Nitrosomonas sp. TaxID=156424 RepID=UPI00260DAF30|nr:hypothetical protein [uncultured Nitrosomonas sp.]